MTSESQPSSQNYLAYSHPGFQRYFQLFPYKESTQSYTFPLTGPTEYDRSHLWSTVRQVISSKCRREPKWLVPSGILHTMSLSYSSTELKRKFASRVIQVRCSSHSEIERKTSFQYSVSQVRIFFNSGSKEKKNSYLGSRKQEAPHIWEQSRSDYSCLRIDHQGAPPIMGSSESQHSHPRVKNTTHANSQSRIWRQVSIPILGWQEERWLPFRDPAHIDWSYSVLWHNAGPAMGM